LNLIAQDGINFSFNDEHYKIEQTKILFNHSYL